MASKTTIQLDQETKKMLEKLREERGAKSYAEVIRQLAKNAKALEKSDLGSLPNLKAFRREKLDRLD